MIFNRAHRLTQTTLINSLPKVIQIISNGNEGFNYQNNLLIGKTILFCIQGDKNLDFSIIPPIIGKYNFNTNTGLLTLGANRELNQSIKILYS